MSWERVRLSDCCVSIADGDHQAPPKSSEGIPFVTIANITNNRFDFANTMYVPESYYEKLDEKRKPHRGDVLYSVVGSFGIPVLLTDETKFVFQRHIAILRPNEKILSEYLYYTMRSPAFYAKADIAAIGAAQRTISLSALRNMEVELPPISVQKAVVQKLHPLDMLIDNNQRQIKLLEEAAQRLYKEWFVDLRFPGHETTTITDGIPEGWRMCTMEEMAEYINGYAFKPSDWGEHGKPIIKIKELNEGITGDTSRNTGENIPSKYVVNPGDILFSWSATLTAMIWDSEVGLLNQHLFKVIPIKGISREFMLQSILKTLDEFQNLTTGSTMKHIQRGKLKQVYVCVPDSQVMAMFERQTERIRNQILIRKHTVEILTEARDRLLPKLMKANGGRVAQEVHLL